MALKKTTSTIPIVFVQAADPVGTGLVKTLARPGGNVTGFSNFTDAIIGKQLELLREVAQHMRRVAVIHVVGDPTSLLQLSALRKVAWPELQISVHEVKGPADFDAAFSAIARNGPTRCTCSSTRRHTFISSASSNSPRHSASSPSTARRYSFSPVDSCRIPTARRPLPAQHRVRRPDPQGGQACRSAGSGADEVDLAVNLRTARALTSRFRNRCCSAPTG